MVGLEPATGSLEFEAGRTSDCEPRTARCGIQGYQGRDRTYVFVGLLGYFVVVVFALSWVFSITIYKCRRLDELKNIVGMLTTFKTVLLLDYRRFVQGVRLISQRRESLGKTLLLVVACRINYGPGCSRTDSCHPI
jgi:hypothetical protein